MVVARKNVRDLRGSVINPRDHLVLPDKRRLSRNDVSELLSNQQFWTDNPHMRSLIPQLLEYMVSPYKGKPTVAGKKMRGGGVWEEVFRQVDAMDADDQMPDLESFAGNPGLASRLTDHYARRTPTPLRHGATARPTANPAPLRRGATARPTKSQLRHGATKRMTPPPERDGTANMPPGTRNMVYTYGSFMENNSNMSDAPLRHGATARPTNNPARPTNNPASMPTYDQKPAAQPVPLRHGATARQPNNPAPMPTYDQKPAAQPVPLRHGATARPNPPTGPVDDNEHDEWLNASPAASTVTPSAPPAKPIPPVSAPTAPPVHGVVSQLSWLMDEAFRQNRTAIVQKLYPLITSKRAHSLSLVDLVKVAGLSEDEFVALTDLHRAGNVLNFPHGDRSGISSNGIKVNHVHDEQFGPRSGPARPVVIRTNSGTAKIKSFA